MNRNIYELTENEAGNLLEEAGVMDLLKKGIDNELPPKLDDLARLYLLVRERKPFEILEFGSGFSTIVMAFALKQNWVDYLNIISKKDSKKQEILKKPKIISLETAEQWMQNTKDKIKKVELEEFSEITYSDVKIDCIDLQVCHFYLNLPDIVPDFVYLDGPTPSSVQGEINGLSFSNPKRTVMSGDILKYESTLLPGFFMIIDGRTNNARFLQRMLKRSYDVNYHDLANVTTFELNEHRLGKKNIYGREAYMDLTVNFNE